jgi:hypothetical protein
MQVTNKPGWPVWYSTAGAAGREGRLGTPQKPYAQVTRGLDEAVPGGTAAVV